VTAIFAGLLTKVGVYAIIRTQTLLFPDVLPTWLLLVLAGSTMLVGVLGAIAQDDVKRILSFLIISSIGFMVMGLAMFTVAGIAAAIVYMVHQVVIKTTLFLAGGMIEHTGGSSRLSRLGDMARTAPIVAVVFFVPAMSLVGIPPMSGFTAKFALFDSVVESKEWWILAVSITASLLILFSVAKIWIGVFWAPVDAGEEPAPKPVRTPLLMLAPTSLLVAATIVLGLAAGPVYDYCVRAADDLVDPSAYVSAILNEEDQ
jgi:multicomponent Na+:H+ antiporter subunit D